MRGDVEDLCRLQTRGTVTQAARAGSFPKPTSECVYLTRLDLCIHFGMPGAFGCVRVKNVQRSVQYLAIIFKTYTTS